MKEKKIKHKIISPLIAAFILCNVIPIFSADKVLNADHFVINYNLNNHNYALNLAGKLESYHDVISSFLETDPLNKLNILISENVKPSEDIENNFNIDFIISNGSSFNNPEIEIRKKIFIKYLQNITRNGNGLVIIDKNFIEALSDYPWIGNQFINLIISDMVNEAGISSVDFKKISNYNKDEQQIIYTALIDFIITDYGKKILIQSLKDTNYYNGFYKSLSKITGNSITVISNQFNSYLEKKKSVFPVKSLNKKEQLHSDDEFNDISFSISRDEQIAILQRNEDKFRVFLKQQKNDKIIILNKTTGESFFNQVLLINDEKLVVTEILPSGSNIHIFDIKNNQFTSKKFIPFLFISDIKLLNNMNLIFSAECGISSSIYIINLNMQEFRIITGSGFNYSPVVIKDKLYFISNTDKYYIVESDINNEEFKTIFSSDQKISSLSQTSELLLIFSMKINGLENIYSFDLISGNLQHVIDDYNSYLKPEISREQIYYLLYYKRGYHIFYSFFNH